MMIMVLILNSQNIMIISKYHREMAYQRYIKDQYILMISNCHVLLIMISNNISTNPGPFHITKELPKARGLKISHLNVRSLLPKLDDIRILLKDGPFDIFTISETWLNASILDQELHIPGYSVIRQDRADKQGGGTAAYIRDGIPFKSRPDLNETENCWIEIT